jgi:PAS domain S-box-containing protein
MPLNELLEEAEVALDFAITQKNRTSVEMALVHRQIARALTGATARPDVFDDEEFAEAHFLEEAGGHETALGHYWVAKLQTAYLVGDYESALKCSGEAERRILKGILGMITSAEHVFYTALATAAAATSSPSELSSSLDRLRTLHGRLVNWAEHCPQNFAHKVSLVGAEIARLERKPGEASILYRAAIDEAERQRFIQDEALAHELRARFLLGEHEPAFAAVHIRLARDRYRQWGATVKMSALESEYPHCFADDLAAELQGISIDAMALIKASQAISAETLPDRLFEQILHVVVEVAGAQRGALVLSTGGVPTVRARIEATEEFSVSLAQAPLAQCPDLSSAVLHYAIRTKDVLLLSDAATVGIFAGDPVVRQRGVRSVLCVPLSKQATVVGLLYLENNALTGAFTNELVKVVQVLAAQAVISLENSALLGELQELTGALEERVIERTRQLTDEIAARDEAQAALRELSKTLEQRVAERTADRNALWQLTRDLMLRCTFDGKMTAVNPAWTEILGWHENELVGFSLVDFVHPDDLDHTIQATKDLAEGRSHDRFDNRYRHRDGSYRWISWATRSREGFITATGRDVTHEIEQAQALANTEAQLRQSQKMEAVGQLTGGLAHDFNNLLAGISGALELMQTRIQQGRAQDVDRYMAAAQGATKRAAALTHRLLAFSRRQNLAPKPTDVNRLVAGMQDMIQRTVGPAVPVEVVGASGLWPALVDPSQLENALLNLCLNARDAMPDGGKVIIETANKWLDEHAARQHGVPEGQYLSLCVTDTGSGMSAETISRAFEPFFTTKPQGQGTGLGLSMIYGFAQQSGGQVRIYSELGQGTTVCIYLPRHQGPVDDGATNAEVAFQPRSDQGETVLVVDDESTVRMLLTDTLAELGYSSLEAADSATGLRILESNVRVDLLITDVGLPGGMNGRQMADAARVHRPNLKVLFITGYAENAVLGNGHLEPGMSVMTKPFPIEAMAARIRMLIEK